MPNLFLKNIPLVYSKCKECIHSYKHIINDREYYECSPVREYSHRPNAYINCSKFFNSTLLTRDIFVVITAFVLYPKFDRQDTGIGVVFRNVHNTDGEVITGLNNEEFFNEVKAKLPEAGYTKETLFEPIIFAEKDFINKEWKCISAIFDEEKSQIMLNNIKENFK